MDEVSPSKLVNFEVLQNACISQQRAGGPEVVPLVVAKDVTAGQVAEPRLPYKRGQAAMRSLELRTLMSEGGFKAKTSVNALQ